MRRRDDVMERLASSDPGLVPVEYTALVTVLDRVLEEPAPRPPRGRRRPAAASALLIGALLLVMAAAALAAVGVIRVGAPASSVNHLLGPHRGLGSVAIGGERVLSLEVPDPAGGLPWGLREIRTTRGVGCLQVGRVQNGALGAMGEDGTFANDGRFHLIGPTQLDNAACANLDASGALFVHGGWAQTQASGWDDRRGTCIVPPSLGAHRAHTHYCAPSQLRSVFFGVLGPDALSVTYLIHGKIATVRTSGPDGAYLIIGPPLPRVAAVPPVLDPIAANTSVIRSISYRDGSRCHPQHPKERLCLEGYTPVLYPKPTVAQASAAIHARLFADGLQQGRQHPLMWIEISFRARVPVTANGEAYELTQEYGRTPRASTRFVPIVTRNDIPDGQTVRFRLAAFRPGVYRGMVLYATQGSIPWPLTVGPPGQVTRVGQYRIVVH